MPTSDQFRTDDPNGFRILPEPVTPITPVVEENNAGCSEPQPGPASSNPDLTQLAHQLELGELPASYGSGELFLIGGDPRWLFAYWDVDWSRGAPPDEQLVFRLFRSDDCIMSEQAVMRGDVHWLIQNPEAGSAFYAEIGWVGSAGAWHSLVRSGLARTVAATASSDESAAFVSIPFHLTFERLLALIELAAIEGESLVETISRLQREGGSLQFSKHAAASWSEEQRRILEALLGQEVLERFHLDSLEIERLLRRGIQSAAVKEEALFSRERWDHLLRLSAGAIDLAGS